jgi:hypothetical protein
MHTTSRTFAAALIAIVALAAIGAFLWPFGDDHPTPDRASRSAAPTTSEPSAVPVAPAAPAAGGSAAPAARPAVVSPAPQPAKPRPVLADGRHAVYLTDVDVHGSTVEFDLLQYLATPEEREAYEHAHPEEEDEYYESPFRNDNTRLRRLPVMRDITVVVQQSGILGCDGEHLMDFAAFSDNIRPRSHQLGHLGSNPFWLTVHDGTVTALDETLCAG